MKRSQWARGGKWEEANEPGEKTEEKQLNHVIKWGEVYEPREEMVKGKEVEEGKFGETDDPEERNEERFSS
jgi:hypothetical protein